MIEDNKARLMMGRATSIEREIKKTSLTIERFLFYHIYLQIKETQIEQCKLIDAPKTPNHSGSASQTHAQIHKRSKIKSNAYTYIYTHN